MTPQEANRAAQQQQRQYADPPNYPQVTQRQFATQITYTAMDHAAMWPVAHNSEQAARQYAEDLSARVRGDVSVYGLLGQLLGVYRDGAVILEAPGSRSGKVTQSSIG